MNNKKKKRLIEASLLFMLLAGIVTGLYFGLFAPKDYRDLIPAESKAVIELPYSTLSELGLFANDKDANFKLQLNGIDKEKSVFMIITPNEYIGLIMKTKNLARVGMDISDGAKSGLCQTPTRSEGFSWTWVDKGWLIAWNEEATLVLGPGSSGERDAMKQTALKMFRANKSQSFRNSEHHKLLNDIEGEAKVYVRADAIPMPMGTIVRLGLPDGVSATKVVLVGSLEDKVDGKSCPLFFKGNLTSEDKDVAKLLYERGNGKMLSTEITNETPSYDIVMGINAKGAELVSHLKKEADGKMLLSAIDNIVNIKNLLLKAEGDIVVAASRLTDSLPEFTLTMQKDTSSVNSKNRMKAEEIFADGEQGVQPYADGLQKVTRHGTIYVSENDTLLYIRTREGQSDTPYNNLFKAQQKNIRQYLYVNLEKTGNDGDADNPLRLLSKFLPGKKSLTFCELSNGELSIKFE